MATKLKSFEQFVSEMDRTEEIEMDGVEMGEPNEMGPEEAEEEAETVQADDEEESVEESDEVNENMELKKLEDAIKMFQDKIKSQGRVTNARDEDHLENLIRIYKEMGGKNIKESAEVNEDEAEKIEDEIKDMGAPKTLAEMLAEMYEGACKEEAKAYEEDAHDEHTIESYMKENAALVAGLMAKTLKEMKEEYAVEAYEAACNEMVESYTKKMNEMKEMDSVADAEDAAE